MNKLVTATKTKALAAAGNYDAEDTMSESATAGTLWDFDFGDIPGGSIIITKAIAACSVTALTPRLNLCLFTGTPAGNLNDNVANTSPLDATIVAKGYAGRLEFPPMSDLGGDSVAIITPGTAGNLPLTVKCATGTGVINGIVVTQDAITGETAGMNLTIILEGMPL